MKIALMVGFSILTLVGVVTVIGFLLPVKHVATRRADFSKTTKEIWNLISGFEASPSWRSEVKAVEKIQANDGSIVWREVSQRGEVIDYTTVESLPEQKLTR